MRFDLLNQSIELNATESPSVYNALNMIRALFQDVEDAADASLSQCPLGDEKLPLEMIWLSKELLSIYEDNTDALQRNRARLDSVMEKLRSTQAELEQLADAAKLLPEKEAQYQKLLRQLESAGSAQAAYAELLGKIEAAQKELAQLNRFDMDAARQQLTQLQNQLRQLEEEIRTLDSQIQQLKTEIAASQEKLAQELRPEYSRLTSLKQELEEQKRSMTQLIADLTTETNTLSTELAQLRKDLPLRMLERDTVKRQVADYRRDILNPIITERDALLQTQAQLQADKDSAEKQISELNENQQKLILEIGRKKEAYIRDNDEYKNQQAREKKLLADQEELTRSIRKATDDLALRQAEYDKLHNETLPEAEKLLADETQRRDTLQAAVKKTNTEIQNLTADITSLEKALPGLETELGEKQDRYKALRATYASRNQDILDIEQKIDALKKKNDKERLNAYRIQLQEEEQRLLKLGRECDDLEAQIRELDRKVSSKNEARQTLESLKRKKEEGLRSIEATLESLRPCSTPEYRRKAEAIEAQFSTLVNIRNNLANSISIARRAIIGYELTSEESYILMLEEYLTNASVCSRDVYQQLTNCAKALKNHIMEEPT